MIMLTGIFPSASGELTRHERTVVSVTQDGSYLHLQVPSCGHGTVSASIDGTRGTFTPISHSPFGFSIEPEGSATRYRVFDGNAQIANGTITGLRKPP